MAEDWWRDGLVLAICLFLFWFGGFRFLSWSIALRAAESGETMEDVSTGNQDDDEESTNL